MEALRYYVGKHGRGRKPPPLHWVYALGRMMRYPKLWETDDLRFEYINIAYHKLFKVQEAINKDLERAGNVNEYIAILEHHAWVKDLLPALHQAVIDFHDNTIVDMERDVDRGLWVWGAKSWREAQ